MGVKMTLMYHRTCEYCERGFMHRQPQAKTCSETCRKARQNERTGRKATIHLNIPPNTVGAISELVAAADLMSKGYSVFRALSTTCYCDLIAVKDGTTYHVEVRTAYRSTVNPQSFNFPKKLRGSANLFALYERNSGQVFYLSTSDLAPVLL